MLSGVNLKGGVLKATWCVSDMLASILGSCVNLYNLLVKEPLFGLYHIERCLFLIWSSKGAKMC